MNTTNTAIKIQNLTKTFYIFEDPKFTLKSLFNSFLRQGKTRKFKALDNVNLEIYKGEFFGFIGHNGSGKSTLLKIIAGIYSGDKGSNVDYYGKLVPFLELGVGFNAELTGRENVFLNGTILGMSIAYLRKKFDEIVEFSGIGEYINMPVKNYSSGMQIRLAFSIAIQSDADIYLLDEVFGVGDIEFQKKSLAEIVRLKKEGKTVILVSHSPETLKTHCDRVCIMKKGQVYEIGNALDLINKHYPQQKK